MLRPTLFDEVSMGNPTQLWGGTSPGGNAVAGVAFALIALACLCPTPSGGSQAAVAVDSPFHPLLCDTAIAAAHRASDFGSPTACDFALLADGLFCRGMQDDPIALDASIGSDSQLRVRKQGPGGPDEELARFCDNGSVAEF